MNRVMRTGLIHGIVWSLWLVTGWALADESVVSEQLAPTRQWIRPAGDSLSFAGRPVDLQISQDGVFVVVKDDRGLVWIDVARWTVTQELSFPQGGGSMHGLALAEDGRTVWATTAQDTLYEAVRSASGTWEWRRSVVLRGPDDQGDSHGCGLAWDEPAHRLYVCLSRNNALAVVDTATAQFVHQIPVGVAPFDVLLLPDRQQLAVSNWGGRHPRRGEPSAESSGTPVLVDERGIAASGTVGLVDLPQQRQVRQTVTGLHPADLCWDPWTEQVIVANANSDTVSILAGDNLELRQTILVRPDERLPFGSASNAVALSEDGRWLFVANAGNNALAVLQRDLQHGQAARDWQLAGFVPTAWYPAALAVRDDRVFVANTKGYGSRADLNPTERSVYAHLGVVSAVPLPDAESLKRWTEQVRENTHVPAILANRERHLRFADEQPAPVPRQLGAPSVFEHVVYVIKENRTYDQVLGDLPQGNGDPELCLYPREVTPNHHALAEEFVLLDNYYCNGINSADGHAWSTEGNVTDNLEKSFGGFTRSYTFGDDPLSFSSSGFIWDHVLLRGHSFRNYGEMDYAEPIPADATFLEIYRDHQQQTGKYRFRQQIGIEALARYTCPDYPGWNMQIPDVLRADRFIAEIRRAEAEGRWYNFMIVYLPQNHTSGLSVGMPTPAAHMADNDLALGKIIEAITRSSFWAKTCVFVIEDDPQGGFDHVDGHRSLCLVVSPYSRLRSVVSEFYNQTSVLHTMERILGIPPMNQMDAMSPLMFACFGKQPELQPYRALPPQIPLDQVNTESEARSGTLQMWFAATARQDLKGFDRADDGVFNRILWHAAKGAAAPFPESVTGAHGQGLGPLGLRHVPEEEAADADGDD